MQIGANAVLKTTGINAATTRSIQLISTTTIDSYTKGVSASGGLFALVPDAKVTANLSHSSTVEVGESAELQTDGTLLVYQIQSFLSAACGST